MHLPHVSGMITDLDAHVTQRALASLSAELTRRERILAAAGVKDIEDYTERAGRQPRSPALPRLAAELSRRQDLLAAGGYAGITEQRRTTNLCVPRTLS